MMKNMLRKLRSTECFTIIEVAISMAFILFIVQGVAMVSLYAQKSSLQARRTTGASMLAEQLMEQYRNKDYDNLAAYVGASPADDCFDTAMETVACGGGEVYTRATTVTAGPVANVLNVDVTVTWQDSVAWSSHHDTGVQEAKLVSLISKF